ncbi:YfhO family protein [Candidatus Gottesmanbacteria bacterium]|nr:YfhO family protein [Candidatus Gottesmanbacteria bacterium]
MTKKLLPFCFLLLVAAFFFQKTLLKGLVPFPADLLVAEYQPWRSQSFLGYAPGAVPEKAQYFDVLQQLYPWKTLALDSLKSGKLPLWNPYNFSGSPLLANGQSAILYPLNLLYGLLPQLTAWTLLIILTPLLASIFTYLYCRKLSLSPVGSLLAGIAFGYSLFVSVFLEYNTLGHVILWLPLALWAIEAGRQRLSSLSLGVFGFSLVAAGFAGHLQLFVVTIIFVSFYSYLRLKKFALLSCYLAVLLISLGIGAIQHIPTWELLGLSARANHPYQYLVDTLLIQPQQLLKFVSPDIFGNPATRNYLPTDSYPSKALYIGLIPLVLALSTIFVRKKNGFVRIFWTTSVVLLLATVRSPISERIYHLPIPFLSTSSPTNAVFLLSFSMAVLAGLGLDHMRSTRKQLTISIIAVAALLLLSWALAALHVIPIQKNNLIYSTLVLGVSITGFALLWKTQTKRLAVAILIILTVFDLFYFFGKFNPFVPPTLVFPTTMVTDWLKKNTGIDRFWGYGTAAIAPNIATQFGIFSPDGYDPLYPRRYGELINASKDGNLLTQFTNQTRSDAKIAPGYGELDLPNNPYRLKLLQLLGVRYILDRSENGSTQLTFPSKLFSQKATLEDWRIYEYRAVLPRAYLASNYEVYTSAEQFEHRFFDPTFDPRRTILLEEKPDFVPTTENSSDSLRVATYEPNNVVIDIVTTSPRLLFLSDTYFSGWVATIDGAPTKVYRAFYAFRAVVVPPGNHIVSFSYRPQSFLLGKKVTIISMILFAIALYALPKTFDSHRFDDRVRSQIL